MLKIHTDLSLLSLGDPVALLFPFIGIPAYDLNPNNIVSGRYNEYFERGNEFIQLTNIEDCDVCLLPIYFPAHSSTEFNEGIYSFIKKVESYQKKIFVFTGQDFQGVKININNAIIFNGAINKSEQENNVHSWPHFFEDYVHKYHEGTLPLRKKGNKPIVGFCGYAPPFGVNLGREKVIGFLKLVANFAGLMKKYPDRSSHSYRARAILALNRSSKVKCNFKIKQTFAFGPGGLNTGATTESNNDFRRNFVNNIIESDYTICVRGIGNNSIRFFETVCCGRIPVFINTNSVLPFDHMIDWKKLCVWIDEKDIDKVGEKVHEFHQNISDEDFIQLQKDLRAVWEEYLSPFGFFKNLKTFLN